MKLSKLIFEVGSLNKLFVSKTNESLPKRVPKSKSKMSQENPIYLDYNATTPLSVQVREAMIAVLKTHFGMNHLVSNSSSLQAIHQVVTNMEEKRKD